MVAMVFTFYLHYLVSLQGKCRPLSQYDFLDLGDVEENRLHAQSPKGDRPYIVDPDLAQLVAQHIGPEDAKTVIFECNPGMYLETKWKSACYIKVLLTC